MVDPETQLDDKWNIILQRMFFSGIGQAVFFVACSFLSIALLCCGAFCLFRREGLKTKRREIQKTLNDEPE